MHPQCDLSSLPTIASEGSRRSSLPLCLPDACLMPTPFSPSLTIERRPKSLPVLAPPAVPLGLPVLRAISPCRVLDITALTLFSLFSFLGHVRSTISASGPSLPPLADSAPARARPKSFASQHGPALQLLSLSLMPSVACLPPSSSSLSLRHLSSITDADLCFFHQCAALARLTLV